MSKKGMPETLRKIINKVNAGTKAKDPAKNPNLKGEVRVRDMAEESIAEGVHGKEYLQKGLGA